MHQTPYRTVLQRLQDAGATDVHRPVDPLPQPDVVAPARGWTRLERLLVGVLVVQLLQVVATVVGGWR